MTVETTHHYLTLSSEDIPPGATQFKCCPPIRSQANQVGPLPDPASGGIPRWSGRKC